MISKVNHYLTMQYFLSILFLQFYLATSVNSGHYTKYEQAGFKNLVHPKNLVLNINGEKIDFFPDDSHPDFYQSGKKEGCYSVLDYKFDKGNSFCEKFFYTEKTNISQSSEMININGQLFRDG